MSDLEKETSGHDDVSQYPEHILKIARERKYFGRMNDPVSSAYVKGPCGDDMEFYLVIYNRIIEDIRFYTEGCTATIVCGSVTAGLALGKSIDDALGISPKEVMSNLKGFPPDHRHCSILSVTAIYRAIADYLFKP